MCEYSAENWKLKSLGEIGIWKLKCFNLDMWILKVENWKLKFEIYLEGIWKFEN
jgi:hypothetical protein